MKHFILLFGLLFSPILHATEISIARDLFDHSQPVVICGLAYTGSSQDSINAQIKQVVTNNDYDIEKTNMTTTTKGDVIICVVVQRQKTKVTTDSRTENPS
jgi:hypothetical protein